MDNRTRIGIASLLALTALLVLIVPFTLDRARPNLPLTEAIQTLLN